MIKVAKLENIFWTNGSWEKPNSTPDITSFTEFPSILVDWNDNKVLGTVILTGDWNYAYCEGQWYFLKRIRVADREDSWFYCLIKDWWVNWIEQEVSIKGYCTKTTNRKLLLDNLDYVEPVIKNPCKLLRLNLTDDISVHWWQDLQEIKPPKDLDEEFSRAVITDRDWYRFILQCRERPISDDLAKSLQTNKEARYKKGITLIAELTTEIQPAHWKKKIFEKLKQNFLTKQALKNYSLSKVTQLGEVTIKNRYCLTPTASGGIGQFEETARVVRLDFSNLNDIVHISGLRNDGSDIYAPFEALNLDENVLKVKYSSELTSTIREDNKRYRVLQRQVYLPLRRLNWGTNNDFLYRGHLEQTEIAQARGQDTSAVSGYAEVDPLIPIYQGHFAQGVKSKSIKDNLYLPFINQLDTTFNWNISSDRTSQGQGNINGKIPYLNDDHPPEFGFLLFNFLKKRENWTWWHYTADTPLDTLPVLTGLKTGWTKPEWREYDNDASKWVDRVSKWWGNFRLFNSLYPFSWVWYFSALRDNKLKISFRDWTEWGGTSGFFKIPLNKEGEQDFTTFSLKNYLERNIDNNTLGPDYIENVRTQFFNKYGVTEDIVLPTTIYKNDIFFNDLRAFWEEYDSAEPNYQYQVDSGWYLNTQKNHRALKKRYKSTTESPKLVFYWNNNLKRYQIGIYYTYAYTHSLNKKVNDIERVKFREDNTNTTKNLEAAPDGVTEKTVRYHHIQQIRNVETKAKVIPSSYELEAFKDWAKSYTGNQELNKIDRLLKAVSDHYDQMGQHTGYGWVEPYTDNWRAKWGLLGGDLLRTLPKKGNEYDLDKIYQLFNIEISSDNYWERIQAPFNKHTTGEKIIKGWQGIGSTVWDFFSGGNSVRSLQNEIWDADKVDVLKLNGGAWIAISTSVESAVRKIAFAIKNIIKPLRKKAEEYLGDAYTFEGVEDFIKRLNTTTFQKDIYSSLHLLNGQGQIIRDTIDIKRKIFKLVGTQYHIYIDEEENPHLIFDPAAIKTDIQLQEHKVFRLPNEEVPHQDYIDAINQQTSIQIVTAQYPLQERLLFEDRHNTVSHIEITDRSSELTYGHSEEYLLDEDKDHYGDSTFKLIIDRFSVENKANPNDYYIINYQGARQLIDVKLGIPKRTLAETHQSNLVAMAQLAFEQEKWRAEFKNRQELFQYNRDRELKELKFRREHLDISEARAGMDMAMGAVNTGVAIAGAFAGHYGVLGSTPIIAEGTSQALAQKAQYTHKSKQIKSYSGAASGILGGVSQMYSAGLNLRELALEGRELQADIIQKVGQLAVQANQLETEHQFNERHFALQLMQLGNVYEQGEVNDRDITDQYNKSKGLNEVHLIYRIPSAVQREGIERYYELYGVNCQIPNVEFKFTKDLKIGEIWQFSFIDTITNLWATEDRETLKTIFANGFKILKLVAPAPLILPERPKAWETRMGELLSEGTTEQKTLLFNQLKGALDQLTLIDELAKSVADKNSLLKIILPLLDKPSILAKVIESDNIDQKTKFVLKILSQTDQDKIFDEILSHKDKVKLIENWIDGGSNLARVLWDKYPDQTISKEVYTEEVQKRDETIASREKQLKTLSTTIEDQKEKLDETNKALANTSSRLRTQIQNYNTAVKAKSQLSASLVSVRNQLTTANAKVKDLDKEVAKFKKQSEDAKAEKDTLTLQYDKKLEENQELQKQLTDFKERESTLLKEQGDKNNEIEQLKKEKVELEEKVKECAKWEEAQEQLEECKKSLEAVREIEKDKECKINLYEILDRIFKFSRGIMTTDYPYSHQIATDDPVCVFRLVGGGLAIGRIRWVTIYSSECWGKSMAIIPCLLHTNEHNGIYKSEYYGFFALKKNTVTNTYWRGYKSYLTKRINTWEDLKTHILGYYGKEKAYCVCEKYSYNFSQHPWPEFVDKNFNIISPDYFYTNCYPDWKVAHQIYWNGIWFTWNAYENGKENKEIKTMRDYATVILGFDPFDENYNNCAS